MSRITSVRKRICDRGIRRNLQKHYLLTYAKIGADLIDYVSDTTPTKIGKYTPGTHIPVKSHEHFLADSPPFTVLLAWNHKREIFKKEKRYRENGGKFITFFPDVTIE